MAAHCSVRTSAFGAQGSAHQTSLSHIPFRLCPEDYELGLWIPKNRVQILENYITSLPQLAVCDLGRSIPSLISVLRNEDAHYLKIW